MAPFAGLPADAVIDEPVIPQYAGLPDDALPGSEAPAKKPSVFGEFGKGLAQGTLGMAEMVGGVIKLAGDVTGINPISNVGKETLNYWRGVQEPFAADVSSYKDIKPTEEGGVGRVARYAAHGIGSIIPTVAASLASGGAGAGVASARAIAGMAGKEIAKDVAEAAVKKATIRGALAGAGAMSYGMEVGSIYSDQDQAGKQAPFTALAAAIPAAALDVIPETRLLAKFVKPLQSLPLFKTAEGRNWIIRGTKEAIAQGGIEGGTEFLQTLIEQKGALRDIHWEEAINAGLIGALGGGVFGGVGGAITKPDSKTKSEPEATLIDALAEKVKNPDYDLGTALKAEPVTSLEPWGERLIYNPETPFTPSERREMLQFNADNEMLKRVEAEDAVKRFDSANPVIPEASESPVQPKGDIFETTFSAVSAGNMPPELSGFKKGSIINALNSRRKGGALNKTHQEIISKVKLAAKRGEERDLALQVVADADGYTSENYVINGEQAPAKWSNKTDIFPWMGEKTFEDTTPVDVKRVMEKAVAGGTLGVMEQRIYDAAIGYKKESLIKAQEEDQARKNKEALASAGDLADQQLEDLAVAAEREGNLTGDTSFNFGANVQEGDNAAQDGEGFISAEYARNNQELQREGVNREQQPPVDETGVKAGRSDLVPGGEGEEVLDPAQQYAAEMRAAAIGLDTAGWSSQDYTEFLNKYNSWAAEKNKTLDRRTDSGKRKRIEDMTPDEMRAALLVDDLTGLGNRRAYEESPVTEFEVSADADSLKWVNDNMGHPIGDELLRAVGRAFKDEHVEAFHMFHISGDEFILKGNNQDELNAAMELIQNRLDNAILTYTAPDGTVTTKKGIGVSYGIGTDAASADESLQRNKEERARTGKRPERGNEPPGVVRQAPAGREAEGEAAEEEEVVLDLDRSSIIYPTRKTPSIRDLVAGSRAGRMPTMPAKNAGLKPVEDGFKLEEPDITPETDGEKEVDKGLQQVGMAKLPRRAILEAFQNGERLLAQNSAARTNTEGLINHPDYDGFAVLPVGGLDAIKQTSKYESDSVFQARVDAFEKTLDDADYSVWHQQRVIKDAIAKMQLREGELASTKPEVKKGPDFEQDGTWRVTMPDGTVYGLFHDKQYGNWYYEQNTFRGYGTSGEGILVVANKAEAIEKLQAEHDAGKLTDPKVYSEPAAGSDTGVTSKFSVDLAEIWNTAASKTYDGARLGNIAIREVIQNSLDAVIIAQERGEIKKGTIDLKTTANGIIVEDNGIGMSAEDIANRFLTLGDKSKNQQKEGRFGGFGLAKAVILGFTPQNTWKLWSRGFYTDSDITNSEGKIQHAEKPRRGTRLVSESSDTRSAFDWAAPFYARFTEPPKGITLTYNDETIKPPALGKSLGSRTFFSGDGTSIEVTAYKKAFMDPITAVKLEGYVVLRLVDPATGAKLVQGIDYQGLPGMAVVDITTNKTPSDQGYPLSTSRNSLAWGGSTQKIRDYLDAFKMEQKTGRGDETETTEKSLAEAPKWKSTVARAKTDKILKSMTSIVNEWYKETEPGLSDLIGPLVDTSTWTIRTEKGAKLPAATPVMMRVAAAYEAIIRMGGVAAKIKVGGFHILDYDPKNGVAAHFSPGSGDTGFNPRNFDYNMIFSPTQLMHYFKALTDHELTHSYESEHNQRFASYLVDVAKTSTNAKSWVAIQKMCEALAGKTVDAEAGILRKKAMTVQAEVVTAPPEIIKEYIQEEQYELFERQQAEQFFEPFGTEDQLGLFGERTGSAARETEGAAHPSDIEDRGVTGGAGVEGDLAGAPGGVRPGERGVGEKYSLANNPQELTMEKVQTAFKGQTVTEAHDGFEVSLDNGRTVKISKVGDIWFDRAAAKAAYGREIEADEKPVAAFQRFENDGIISLTERGVGELPHETFHAAMELALTKGQQKAVLKKYGTEEAAAKAYQEFRDAETPKPETFFQKIKDLFTKLREFIAPTAEGTFEKLKSGEAWKQAGDAEDIKIKAKYSLASPQATATTLKDWGHEIANAGATLATRNVGQKLDRVAAFFMPMNRMIDAFKERAQLKPVKPLIEKIGELAQKQRTTQDDLLSYAGLRYNQALDAVAKGKGFGADPEKIDRLNDTMAKATLWQLDPGAAVADSKIWTEQSWKSSKMEEKTGFSLKAAQAKLNSEWAKMTPEMQTAYKELLDSNHRAWTMQKKANIGLIERIITDPARKARLLAQVEKRFSQIKGTYFPLMRFGEYVVSIKSPAVTDDAGNTLSRGKTHYSAQFESKADALALEAAIRKDPSKFLQDAGMTVEGAPEVSMDQRSKMTRASSNIPASFIEKLKSTLDVAGGVDMRKELRSVLRGVQKEIKSGSLVIPDAVVDKMTEISKADSVPEAERLAKELKTLLGKTQEEQEVLSEIMDAIDSAGLASDVADSLKHDFDQLWLSALPETSVMKNFIKRKGVLGFNDDMLRSYLAYHQKHARGMAFIKYGTQIGETLNNMEKTSKTITDTESRVAIQEFTNLMRDHQQHIMTEKVNPIVQQLTKIPFAYYLSSPSTFIVQSSQPFTLTLPFLATRFGFGKAFAAINRGYARQFRGEFKDAKLLAFNEKHQDLIDNLKELDDNGDTKGINDAVKGMTPHDRELLALAMTPTLSISLSHEAMDVITNGGQNQAGIMKKLGFFMELSETSSRKAGFMAAFDLKYKETGDFSKALKTATDTVNDTLYDYSAANRPKVLSGNAGRLLGQFRVYQIQTAFKVLKLVSDSSFMNDLSPKERSQARKELGLLMAMNFALAGAVGLPGMKGAYFIANTLHALLGDDDEPFNAEMEFHKFLKEKLGGTAGGVAGKGLPTLLGMDISRRVGAGGITSVFQSEPPEGKHGTDLAGWYAANLLGPTYSTIVSNPMKAMDAYRRGDWLDALKAGMPKPVQDLARAYATATEGMTTGSGQLMKGPEEFTAYDIALAALGINPTALSLPSEEHQMEARYSTQIQERRSLLVKKFVQAIEGGTQDDVESAVDAVTQFNTRMPLFGLKGSDLIEGYRSGMKKKLGLITEGQEKIKMELEEDQKEGAVEPPRWSGLLL